MHYLFYDITDGHPMIILKFSSTVLSIVLPYAVPFVHHIAHNTNCLTELAFGIGLLYRYNLNFREHNILLY